MHPGQQARCCAKVCKARETEVCCSAAKEVVVTTSNILFLTLCVRPVLLHFRCSGRVSRNSTYPPLQLLLLLLLLVCAVFGVQGVTLTEHLATVFNCTQSSGCTDLPATL